MFPETGYMFSWRSAICFGSNICFKHVQTTKHIATFRHRFAIFLAICLNLYLIFGHTFKTVASKALKIYDDDLNKDLNTFEIDCNSNISSR